MARTPKLSIWTNKNDFTVYFRGVKIFRGTQAEVDEFCDNFDYNGTRLSNNQFYELAAELGIDFGTPAKSDTIKFQDADGNEYDTGIEQPNDPDFDITENEAKVLRADDEILQQ